MILTMPCIIVIFQLQLIRYIAGNLRLIVVCDYSYTETCCKKNEEYVTIATIRLKKGNLCKLLGEEPLWLHQLLLRNGQRPCCYTMDNICYKLALKCQYAHLAERHGTVV